MQILARAGERVERGQPLFSVQSSEMVQAQNDYLSALNVLSKGRSQLTLAQAAEKRQRDLYESRATTLRELQNAQNDLNAAQNDARTAEVGLEAVRNRLRILGLRDDEMTALQKGAINPTRRSTRRSAAPSSSARSGRASTSATAASRPTSSATCRRSG